MLTFGKICRNVVSGLKKLEASAVILSLDHGVLNFYKNMQRS